MSDDTNFRVQVNLNGNWVTLFHADFVSAMAEVRKLRKAGRLARFSGDGSRPWSKRRSRREYRAVR